jgi:hypothetical protein
MARTTVTAVLLLGLVAACSSAERAGSPDGGGAADDPGQTGGGGAGEDCPGVPCDLVAQCGCRDGEACDLAAGAGSAEDTACRAAGSGTAADSCAAPEDCAPGYVCQEGQCWRWCAGDGDCGEEGHCLPAFSDAVGARTCTKPCKPESATASGCPEGFGCRYYLRDPNGAEEYDGDEYEYTDCSPAGSGTHGADCSGDGEAACAQGYGCYDIAWTDGSTTTECREICVFTVAGEPAENTCQVGTCHEWLDPGAVIADVEYGTCW